MATPLIEAPASNLPEPIGKGFIFNDLADLRPHGNPWHPQGIVISTDGNQALKVQCLTEGCGLVFTIYPDDLLD